MLNLTGAEISLNTMPDNTNIPFVHYHKENEEIYYIIPGKGYFILDGEKLDICEGDFIRVSPHTKRQLFVTNEMKYICIQVKENSLKQFTNNDGILA